MGVGEQVRGMVPTQPPSLTWIVELPPKTLVYSDPLCSSGRLRVGGERVVLAHVKYPSTAEGERTKGAAVGNGWFYDAGSRVAVWQCSSRALHMLECR